MKTLKMTRVLTYEPDRAGNFYSLTPRVLINLEDLAATGVVQPGSRVSYRELWRGEPQALETYRELIKPGLAANQRIQDARDGNRQIGGALGKAERYLNMASLVAVLLAGVAVALSANRFASRRFDASALLRCLGLSRRETMVLFSLQLTALGLVAAISGALLGWLAQLGLFALLHDLLPSDVPPGACSRPSPESVPDWWRWPVLPCRHLRHWAGCHRCGCCAATCCRFRRAPGWCTARRWVRWA